MGVLSVQAKPMGCAALAWLALLSTGCVPTFDDKLSIVERPKVLAIQSEPAEAAPGEQVSLTALVATPEGDLDTPELSWGLCIARKPLTELGPVNSVCIQAPDRAPDSIVSLGSGASVSATLPMDACRLFGPSLPEPMNGEPAGRPVDPDPTGGYYQPIGVTLRETSVTSLGAVRIFCPPSGLDQEQSGEFNSSYRRNQNPRIDSVALLADTGAAKPVPEEPDSLQIAAGQTVHLQASWASCPTSPVCGDGVCGPAEDKTTCPEDCTTPKGCTGAEAYARFNPDSRLFETLHESIRVSWFATAGSFRDAVTGRDESEFASSTTEDAWTAPSSSGPVRLWLVIRDARGGQSFRTFIVAVAP
jgi:hypothetical protein